MPSFKQTLSALIFCTVLTTGCSLVEQDSSRLADHSAANGNRPGGATGGEIHQAIENGTAGDYNWFAPEVASLNQPAPDIWESLRKGFRLRDEMAHPRVAVQRRLLLEQSSFVEKAAENSTRYLYHVKQALVERNFPLELAFLPMIESGYDPRARSASQATGMWQLIPSTARHLGLRKNTGYDGSRDVVESTEAALQYLDQMQKHFDGDWLLTLAAYNAGQGAIDRAIERNRALGKPTDFWHLNLPQQTMEFVPRILAFAQLAAEADKYQVALPNIPDRPYFVTVDIARQIELSVAAELAKLPLEEIERLNPGYRRGTTDSHGNHRLLIPAAQAEALNYKLSLFPAERAAGWQHYKVKEGDSLESIAQRFDTSTTTIQQLNELDGSLRTGEKLVLPAPWSLLTKRSESGTQGTAAQHSESARDSGEKGAQYRVRQGDTPWRIARQHGISLDELTRLNGEAKVASLRPGMLLQVRSQDQAAATQRRDPTAERPSTQKTATQRVDYRVRKGDTLYRIASRFKLPVEKILEWNESVRGEQTIKPGDQVTLYVEPQKLPAES